MKLFTIILFSIISGFLCFNQFEIIESTSQKWTGGTRGAGYGTNYEINIIPNTNSEKLTFDKLWIGEKYFPIQTFQKGKKMRNNLFGKADTITIRVNNRVEPNPLPFVEKENYEKDNQKSPFQYEGEALLSYTYKGKRKYKEIEKFTKLEPLLYP